VKTQVEVDGEAGHLSQEQVDRCAALEREQTTLEDGWGDLDQESWDARYAEFMP